VITLRTNTTLRVGLALAILLSWFAFSNRCALGQLLSSRQSNLVQHECCDKKIGEPHRAPAKTEPQDCCKTLDVLSASSAKVLPCGPVVLATMLVFQFAIDPADNHPIATEGTGPPEAASFAELVLQRSLLSHAPPFCA
jgi:hypothetical protein